VIFVNLSVGGDEDIDSIRITSTSIVPSLPVKFSNISVNSLNSSIKVNWSVATELNINQYEIERSSNGSNFVSIGTIASRGNSTSLINYNFIDGTPINGVNFYRIKAIEKDGNSSYTSVVKINASRGKVDMAIAPNPIRGREMNVQLSSLTKGTYTLRLYNNVGQEVFNKQVSTDGGSLTQTFTLPSSVKAGMYNVQLTGNETKLIKKVIVE
jgi:hypothetical protein